MLENDQLNIDISDRLLVEHGLEEYFGQCLGLFDDMLKIFYKTFPPNNVPFWDEGGKPKSHLLLRIVMLLSANTQFHLATSHLMRGQASEIWGHARRAIEAAGIAHLSLSKPELGQLYLDGDIKAFKNQTKTLHILPPDLSNTKQLNVDIERANQRLHQNWVSTASRIGHDMQILGNRFTFALHHHVYDRDLETVLENATWLLQVIERSSRLFADSFEIQDSAFWTNQDRLRDGLAAKQASLVSILKPPTEREEKK